MESFEDWLSSSQKQRNALFSHSKSEIPNEKGLLDADIEKSIRAAEAAGSQLAKARYFLTDARASELRKIDSSVKGVAREVYLEDAVKSTQLLVDEIENLARSLNSRVKAACNGRRSLL